ncbi:MAG: hypothetical protein AUK63_1438 [bacterium P3]|nr:MAG: hypothetical protein AUK63_1438 [bacterium P3]KWW40069.1 MAG: hypothetical protein F083_1791 [bacterium F083]
MDLYRRLSAFCIVAAAFLPIEAAAQTDTAAQHSRRLTVGGYGEAVYSRHFYSDNVFRYSFADKYKDDKGYGRVDLPHAVIMLGYDFGHGWSMGTEIEFEHGGVEAATEKETEETGEFEQEVERGGEVALEQFWVQKSIRPWLNIRAGHIVVPVGMTNQNHTPNMFFGVYRPEGENTIMPCTWHETGVAVWGRAGDWRYEVQLLPALNSNLFNDAGWVHDGSASPYEFRPANRMAGAARIDWTGVNGLRLSVSGYVGKSNNNDITTDRNGKYYSYDGLVTIGSFDFAYRNRLLTVRGNADYGHLGDASAISARNKNQTTMTGNPYPHSPVGESAWDVAIEAGVNVLAEWSEKQCLYLFGRYDHYDSYVPADQMTDIGWCERQVLSGGINYFPVPEIAVKAEAGVRMLASQYNNEPFVALGITWCGFFKH